LPTTLRQYPTISSAPLLVAAIDVNGDLYPDILAASANDDQLSVLINAGLGDATFHAAVNYPLDPPNSPEGMAVADLNGDQLPDVVVVNYSGTMSILLGSSAQPGTYPTRTDYSLPAGAGPTPYSYVHVGDFNRDGHNDIVTPNYYTGSLVTLLGDGSGLFHAPPILTQTPSQQPIAVTTADFNRDGHLDVLLTFLSPGRVAIMLGYGNGSFANSSTPFYNYPAGGTASDAAPVDLNGDGNLDVIIAGLSSNTIGVLLGGIDGTLVGPGASYAVGTGPDYVAVADFDGDGRLDVVTQSPDDNAVYTLLGNGDGTFGLAIANSTGASTYPASVCAADVNGDGQPVIITANSGSNTVSILYTPMVLVPVS
ncbi:MAG: VCBS repeat-containing protein, partial [Mycobacterium sp.]|nr:VCBS repeat-containing protein [Mycobacterium sp.]